MNKAGSSGTVAAKAPLQHVDFEPITDPVIPAPLLCNAETTSAEQQVANPVTPFEDELQALEMREVGF